MKLSTNCLVIFALLKLVNGQGLFASQETLALANRYRNDADEMASRLGLGVGLGVGLLGGGGGGGFGAYGSDKLRSSCDVFRYCKSFLYNYLVLLALGGNQDNSLLGLSVNLQVLPGSSPIYSDFCFGGKSNFGDPKQFMTVNQRCYENTLLRMTNASMPEEIRRDISLGVKAGQLDYITNYLVGHDADPQIIAKARSVTALLDSQLNAKGREAKIANNGKGKCDKLTF